MCKWRGQGKIYFAVFNNVFESPSPVKTVYDLKGSTVGRRAGPESSVLKDLDLQDRKLFITKDISQRLKLQIEKDCQFLKNNDLMDYSLLVGIRRTENPVISSQKKTQPATTDRVPRLVFFIESAKAMQEPKDQKKGLKISRRKSMLELPPNFLTPMEQRKQYAEGEGAGEGEEDANGPTNSETQNGNDINEPIPEDNTNTDDISEGGESPETPEVFSEITNIEPSTATPPTVTSVISSPVTTKSTTTKSTTTKSTTTRRPTKSTTKLERATMSSTNIPNDLGDDGSNFVPMFQQHEGGIQSIKLEEKDDKYYEIYYIGIIDFLQKYNKRKKLANFAKSFKYDKEGLSTVDPTFYMVRFLKMVQKVVED